MDVLHSFFMKKNEEGTDFLGIKVIDSLQFRFFDRKRINNVIISKDY